MSGGVDQLKTLRTSELTKEVMEKFNVDEKTAEQIIMFSNNLALQRMEKWTRNFKKWRKHE